MQELRDIKQATNPHYTFLVVDAMTGQEAVKVAKAFDEAVAIDGTILTKLDGDARGGAALSIKAVVGKPVQFVGVGEKLEALEPFHPDRMASRLLGMGDVLTLIEKAEQAIDQDAAASPRTENAPGELHPGRLSLSAAADQADGSPGKSAVHDSRDQSRQAAAS